MNSLCRLAVLFALSALPVAALAQSSPQDNWTLERTIAGGTSDGLFSNPAAVAVAPDGSIVVADTGNYRIQVFTATGEFVRRFGSQGTGNGQFGSGMYTSGPTSVAVTNDGLIVVADAGNSRIEVFQSDGTFVRAFGSAGGGDGQFSPGTYPLKLAVASDGKIVVADSSNSKVHVFGVDGTFIRKWGVYGSLDGQLLPLQGLAATADGKVVTVDSGSRVQVFDLSGTFIRRIGGTGSGDGQFSSPAAAVTVLADGKIAIADVQGNNVRIQLFDASGAFVRKLGSSGTDDGQFSTTLKGLAGTASSQLVVADTGNGRVQVIGGDGTFVRAFGAAGSATDGFASSTGIGVATDGTLFVGDSMNGRIHVFSAGGQFLRFIPKSTQWLAPARDGNIISGGYGYFEVLTPNGGVVVKIGGNPYGAADGQFGNSSVQAVVDLANGDIYAADPANSRVQVFDSAGTFLRKFGGAGTGPGQLNGLGGLALTPDGQVVVFTTNGYLQSFTKQGAFVSRRSGGYANALLRAVGPDGLYSFGDTYSSSWVLSPQMGMLYSFNGGVGTLDPRTGAVYTFDTANQRVNVWRRGFRTLGANPPKLVPMPGIVATAQRTGTGIVDIDYSVTDGDSSTVTVGIAAFKNGSAAMRDMIVVQTAHTVENTASRLGAGQPTGQVRRVSWDGSAAQVQSSNLVFEVFARDDRQGLIDIDFITLPTNPALTISRIPVTNADLRNVWAWLLLQGDPALSHGSDGEIVGPTGVFTTTSNDSDMTTNSYINTTHMTAAGRAWILAKLGVREATTAELAAARQGTATGTPNQFAPARSQQMGYRPPMVNEWTFDTTNYPAESWWVVPVAQ